METVRNYLNMIIRELLDRAEKHDQTKLEPPEIKFIETYTPKLRRLVYGSKAYKNCMRTMTEGIEHHYKHNRHHPEHHLSGISGMNLIDLLEMLADWKAATLRHDKGCIYRSLEINKARYNMPEYLYIILKNTIDFIESKEVFHKAKES